MLVYLAVALAPQTFSATGAAETPAASSDAATGSSRSGRGRWRATSRGRGCPVPSRWRTRRSRCSRTRSTDNGPNDKGIGLQFLSSLGRLAIGYLSASVAAIFLGVVLGLSPTLYRAVNPYIQILKPVSPLAWMPLFLYTIKDSGWVAVLVIFMSSLWPTLANTAFGVASIRKDYLNVAAILQLSWWRRLVTVILPGAAPAVVAGLRISIGSSLHFLMEVGRRTPVQDEVAASTGRAPTLTR